MSQKFLSTSSEDIRISPITLDSHGMLLRGMLYLPPEMPSQVVVLCNALWEEGECSRRVLTGLGMHLAACGIAAIRFDYAGTGESGGQDFEADLSIYRANINSVVHWAKDRFQSAAIIAVAIRTGANLLLSIELPSVNDVVLIEPIMDIKRHWRDLRIATMLVCPGVNLDGQLKDSYDQSHYILRHGHRLNPEIKDPQDHPPCPIQVGCILTRSCACPVICLGLAGH